MQLTRLLSTVAICVLTATAPVFPQDRESEAAEHFQTAQRAQNAGDYDTAVREYRSAIAVEPNVAEVYVNLGLVYHLQANFEASAKALQQAIALKPELLAANLFLGIDYVHLNQPTRAVNYLRKAIHQEPGNKEADSWLGTALWDAGQKTAALAQLRNAVKLFPADGDLLFLLGEAYQKAANEQIEYVLERAVGTPLYHQAFGKIYADQGVWDKAIGHYQAGIQKNASVPGLHFGLGDVFFQQGKLQEARNEFGQELKINPKSAAALAKLAEVEFLGGSTGDALYNLELSIRISPAEAADTLGLPSSSPSIALESPSDALAGKYRQALLNVQAAPPGDARDLATAALANKLGDGELAVAEWNRFLSHANEQLPADPKGRALVNFERHRFDFAEKELESFILSNPTDAEAHYLLSKTYQHLSSLVLERMLAVDPNSFRTHQLLAKIYEHRDQSEKALAEYRTVEQMQPALSGVHFSIGHLLWTMNEPNEAVGELKKELQLDPDHPEANAEIGTILVAQHESDTAIPYLKKALSLKPDLVTARQQLGMAFYEKKDYPRAEQELKRGLNDDAEGSVHFVLGMVYRRMGRMDESRTELAESNRIRAERRAEVKLQTTEATP